MGALKSGRLLGQLQAQAGQTARSTSMGGQERSCGGFIKILGVGQCVIDLNLPFIFTAKPLLTGWAPEYNLDPSRPKNKFPVLPYTLDPDPSMRLLMATNEFPNARLLILGFRGIWSPNQNELTFDAVRFGISVESWLVKPPPAWWIHWRLTGPSLQSPITGVTGTEDFTLDTTDHNI